MLTLFLQGIVSLAWLTFGVIGLRVARRIGSAHPGQDSWVLTGSTFTICGIVSVLQSGFGTYAFFAGRGSAPWDAYLAWAPALNHSRTTAMMAFFGLLLLSGHGRIAKGRWLKRFAFALLVVGLASGAFIGWRERTFVEEVHYWAMAVLDTGELLLALFVLFVLLVGDRIDRLLWVAISVYAFKLALNAVWSSALTTIRFGWIWSPEPTLMHAYRAALAAIMVVLAYRRLMLAERGAEIPALFEPLQHGRTSLR